MKAETRRVVITGLSVVAGNGRNKEEFLENSCKGVSGIRPCTLYPTEQLRTPYFGQVEIPLVYEAGSWDEEDRMEALMRISLEQMYADAGYTREKMAEHGTKACLCLGSLLGSAGKILAFAKRESAGRETAGWLSHTVDYGSWLREKSGVRGGMYIDSAACASSTTAVGMAFDLIRNGLYDVALAGGADPLTEVSAYGFHALQSLSQGVCSPFDQERDGINIGEGAAFFLMETLESARARNAHIYGEVLGYGLNNDAYHITSPDPEGAGAAASMERAIQNGGLKKDQVDYVNAHGTGTPVNDQMEVKAIGKVFGEAGGEMVQGQSAAADGEADPETVSSRIRTVRVNSTKALVGHCMGASGAVELAAVLLSMEKGSLFPMPNLKEALEVPENVELCREETDGPVRYALSNSFAFAGNTASLLVGAPSEKPHSGYSVMSK
ncbi:MAG TPA: beta-ketoacyl-[acyl-carrier-protein] synthase family protein [Candidatus Blautia gallistercoris]|uniref:Beta-ketoacyl-[acyl-carrier-protein] synthase family protein n=1 Tax=Candidatus Blautia gallistercoris TaxID=2838490 RepID=A0A9D1WHB8_9FIRM|nr:beta-ketoacyl-[acyl-carrier-protein] synthase family protein [Candidatus Blautia gallistercoris]